MAEAILNREPDIQPAAEHLWGWFWDLHLGRQAGMNGWQALSAIEMRTWEAMTGNIVRREEWQILRDMDRSFLAGSNARREDGAPVASSSSEISAAAFDAVFG